MSRLRFIPPQLPSLTDQPPEGADWIHEVKHDGYRGTVRAYTRKCKSAKTDFLIPWRPIKARGLRH